MVPYSKISSRLIKPYNFYTYTEDAKNYFLARFGNDEQSFFFLHYLIRYCLAREEYSGEWPDTITPDMLDAMSNELGSSIQIENSNIYKDGYVIKNGTNYELTHEFIVSSFMCCSDGNFLPLSIGHIDFSGQEKLKKFLHDEVFVKEPQAITFLVKLVEFMGKTHRVLMDMPVSLRTAMQIARENDLIFELCINWAQKYNLVYVDVEEDTVICNALILSAYLASPKLN